MKTEQRFFAQIAENYDQNNLKIEIKDRTQPFPKRRFGRKAQDYATIYETVVVIQDTALINMVEHLTDVLVLIAEFNAKVI